MKIVAIIQARVGSSRLPGKVLAAIAGQSMLSRVIERVRRIPGLSEDVVATTLAPQDEAIVEECGRIGAPFFRGSENDVLDRYYCACKEHEADAVVRITSDCPLIDPVESGKVVDAFETQAADLAANDIKATYPLGLGTEVVSCKALHLAWRQATKPYERQHVTPYIYQHPEQFRLVNVESPSNYSSLRWTVDTPADLEFVRSVFARLDGDFCWHDVLSLLEREPGLIEINRNVRQKAIEEC
jgi:spore coat polysaccharide biosynthesis protein SpsF